MKTETLSDNAVREGDYVDSEDNLVFRKQDVKKSIKRLKEEFNKNDWENNTLDVDYNINPIIDKIFGKELTK